jgi:hypothetical protein
VLVKVRKSNSRFGFIVLQFGFVCYWTRQRTIRFGEHADSDQEGLEDQRLGNYASCQTLLESHHQLANYTHRSKYQEIKLFEAAIFPERMKAAVDDETAAIGYFTSHSMAVAERGGRTTPFGATLK